MFNLNNKHFEHWLEIIKKHHPSLGVDKQGEMAKEFCKTHPDHQLLKFVPKIRKVVTSQLFILWLIAILLTIIAVKGHAQSPSNKSDITVISIDNNGVNKFTAVAPFHVNFTGSITVTKTSSPSGVNVSASGGSGVTAAPPYWTDGVNFFDSVGFQITKPPNSLTWLSNTPGTQTLGTNGDQILFSGISGISTNCQNSTPCFQSVTASTSVDAEFQTFIANSGASTALIAGIWLWDSTNNLIYQLYLQSTAIRYATCNYTGSGEPGSCFTTAVMVAGGLPPSIAHLRWIVSGGNLLGQIYLDGANPITLQTLTAGSFGTLSKGGFFFSDGGSNTTNSDAVLIHEKVQ